MLYWIRARRSVFQALCNHYNHTAHQHAAQQQRVSCQLAGHPQSSVDARVRPPLWAFCAPWHVEAVWQRLAQRINVDGDARAGNVCSVGAWAAYGAMARAHILEWGGRGRRLGRSSSRHCRRRPVKVGASCDVSAQSHVQHKHDMCPECEVIPAHKRCLFHKYIARTIRVPSTEGTETRLYL